MPAMNASKRPGRQITRKPRRRITPRPCAGSRASAGYELNYYRRYVGDYLRDTADLSLVEHGAYCLLLDYYYADESPLPTDRRTIYRRLRAMGRDEQAAIDSILAKFFILEDNGYHQKRVDHEIDVSKKARDSGKLGGRPQSENITEKITDFRTDSKTGQQTDLLTDLQTDSGHPPTTNLQPPATSQPTAKILTQKNPGAKELIALGVPEQVAKDWLIVRKAKRSPLTDTALDDLKLEAAKAGISVADAVSMCAKRGWQGFKASWNLGIDGKGKEPSAEYDPARMHI